MRGKARSIIALLPLGMLLAAAVAVQPAHGAKLYKWVDENGNVSYQDSPPANGADYTEATLDVDDSGTGGADAEGLRELARTVPVTLYATSRCDGCDLTRIYLERRGIPFVEKDVENDAESQEALAKLLGRLEVPTVTVGERYVNGYNKPMLESELNAAGYPTGEGESEDTNDATAQDSHDAADLLPVGLDLDAGTQSDNTY